MRGMPGDGRLVGGIALVPAVRPRRVLRFIKEHARDEALPSNATSGHAFIPAGITMAVVLRRRGSSRDVRNEEC